MLYKIIYNTSQDTLSHFGIPGMKWGVRNEETKARYAREKKSGKSSKEKASIISNTGRQVKNISQNASNIARRFEGKGKKKTSSNVKKMTDEELRKNVNRMNLERQYDQLKSEELNSGKIYASDVLDTVGDVAAIAASVATIYALTHK